MPRRVEFCRITDRLRGSIEEPTLGGQSLIGSKLWLEYPNTIAHTLWELMATEIALLV